ncbi:sensor histidine kinase [Aureimonas fodinaquatilis]|nr:ATP-binding protein [Aureimonas fodinaquatilis]
MTQRQGRKGRSSTSHAAALLNAAFNGLDTFVPAEIDCARERRLRAVLIGVGLTISVVFTLVFLMLVLSGQFTGPVLYIICAASLMLTAVAVLASSTFKLAIWPALKRAANGLSAQESSLLAQSAAEYVLKFDRMGNLVRLPDAATALFSQTLNVGDSLATAIHLRDRVSFLSAFSDLREGRERSSTRLRVMQGDADWILVEMRLIKADSTDRNGAVLGLFDRLPTERAQATSKMPAVANGGLLAAIGEELQSRQHATSAFDLHSLSVAISDLARIEAGLYALQPDTMVLSELVTDVHDSLPDKQRLMIASAADVATTFTGDRRSLHQMLSCVCSNALRQAPQGVVTISIALDEGALTIRVADTGPGIGYEQSAQLPFMLLLAKALCELHYGRMDVSSQIGVGSEVSLCIPADCAERFQTPAFNPLENIVDLIDARKKNQDHPQSRSQKTDRRTA